MKLLQNKVFLMVTIVKFLVVGTPDLGAIFVIFLAVDLFFMFTLLHLKSLLFKVVTLPKGILLLMYFCICSALTTYFYTGIFGKYM